MRQNTIFVGGMQVLVAALGRDDAAEYGVDSWSLQPMQSQLDAVRNPCLSRGLVGVLEKVKVKKVFAPNVSAFSARVVEEGALKQHIYLNGAAVLHRSQFFPADGVHLNKKGHAFMMSGAGCPIIIAADDEGEMLVVAHAGRDSLVDRGAVMGYRARKHVSVVGAIIEKFGERGILPVHILMRMMFSISAAAFVHPLNHPQYGAYNRTLEGFINNRWPRGAIRQNGNLLVNLEGLFEEQAYQAGLTCVSVTHSLAEFSNLAQHDGKERNLYIVKRCS